MSERERWVVYPLLFLALGAALRDKLFDRTRTRSIICQELLVVDEQPLGRDPVLLAKIGRGERSAAGESKGAQSNGYLLLNGDVEVVHSDASGGHPSLVAKIGRSEPAGGPATGFMLVNGDVLVEGAVNAKQYALQGIPLMPALRSLPGVSLPGLWHTIQHAAWGGPDTSHPPLQALAEPDLND